MDSERLTREIQKLKIKYNTYKKYISQQIHIMNEEENYTLNLKTFNCCKLVLDDFVDMLNKNNVKYQRYDSDEFYQFEFTKNEPILIDFDISLRTARDLKLATQIRERINLDSYHPK